MLDGPDPSATEKLARLLAFQGVEVERALEGFEACGESFEAGRDIDTAPRWLGSAELFFDPLDSLGFALQVTGIGEYYLDAENRFTYPGHVIGNLRAHIRPSDAFDLVFRLNNVTDEDYADRADFAFGNYRYLPGRGRELFVELRYTAD